MTSVATALQHYASSTRTQRWALHDCSIEEEVPALAYGPALFQKWNLLQAARGKEGSRHACFQLLIGTALSFTPVREDFYGADGWLELLEGMKVWVAAPPEFASELHALFGEKSSLPFSHLNASQKAVILTHGFHLILQRPGELVYMPGGWPHAVKNLTPTISFGGSYLRAWRLQHLFRYLCDYLDTEEKLQGGTLDLQAIFRAAKGQNYGVHASDLDFSAAEIEKFFSSRAQGKTQAASSNKKRKVIVDV